METLKSQLQRLIYLENEKKVMEAEHTEDANTANQLNEDDNDRTWFFELHGHVNENLFGEESYVEQNSIV